MSWSSRTTLVGRRRAAVEKRAGFTLLEALVTIGLTVIILSVYTAMLTAVYHISRMQFGIQATGFVQEGLDVLRTLEHDELLNRADDRLLALSYTRGDWEITGGSDKKLELTDPAPNWGGETGLAVLPGNYRNDFTYTAKVLVQDASPNDWRAGLALRYRDSENHYRFRIVSNGIAFDEIYQGTLNTLWSQSGTYSKDTWYELEVVVSEDQFTLKRNGVTLTTVTDSRFATGDLALLALEDALVQFNDVVVAGDGAGSWNFDDETNGEYPEEWRRFTPYDLPQGDATLTISDYLGQPEMKQATVTVSWSEAGVIRDITGSSIITE